MDLTPDCGRCVALCCVGLSFDRGPHFPFDKPAGEPCRHLRQHLCAIHRQRPAGCARYDCLGAGQRVTQELFAGRSWQHHPDLLGPMLEAFAALREVHEHLALLAAAQKKGLIPAASREHQALVQALTAAWSLDDQLRQRLRSCYARLALKAEAPG